MNAVRSLRPACSRARTFLWMVLTLMGLCCRSDRAGVTSYIRVLGFGGPAYHRFLHLFHSKGLDLDRLTACWVRLCLALFRPMQVGSRLVCLADGIKAPKEGKQMPAVKMLHQQSVSNSKPEYIMGHSFQAISLLVQGNGLKRVSMMYSGLELLTDCWCSIFTAGICFPSLGALMPSARHTRREPTCMGRNRARQSRTQQAVSLSRSRPLLWN